MKIKFNNFTDVNNFTSATRELESDVMVKHGRYEIDGKSIMGLYTLDFSHELEVIVHDIHDGKEIDKLTEMVKLMGIYAGE